VCPEVQVRLAAILVVSANPQLRLAASAGFQAPGSADGRWRRRHGAAAGRSWKAKDHPAHLSFWLGFLLNELPFVAIWWLLAGDRAGHRPG